MQADNNHFFDQLKEKSSSFKTALPENAWNRIESKLDAPGKEKRYTRRRLLAIAAMILLIPAALFIFRQYLPMAPIASEENNALLYAQNIEELGDSDNSYPVYDVHKLMAAYRNLQISRADNEGSLDPTQLIFNPQH